MKTKNAIDHITKPCAVAGAGPVASFLQKLGDKEAGWHYQFNLFRNDMTTGQVSQLFRPEDLEHLAKLSEVLASEIAQDGCLDSETRDDLACLAACLDMVLPRHAAWFDKRAFTSAEVADSLRAVLDHFKHVNGGDIGADPSLSHILRHLQILDRWAQAFTEDSSAPTPNPANASPTSNDPDRRLNGCKKDDSDLPT